MPHLTSLVQPTDVALQLLLTRNNTALKKLVSSRRVTPEVLANLPQLQELHFANSYESYLLAPWVVEALPLSLKVLKVDVIKPDDATLVTGLIERPLPLLQQLGTLRATPKQLRQLLACHPRITSMDLDGHGDNQTTALVKELQAAAGLKELTLRNAHCSAELVEALCQLPELTYLTIRMKAADVGFWQTLGRLRSSTVSHLPADRRGQLAQLHIKAGSSTSFEADGDQSSEWWLAAIKASFLCETFEMTFDWELDDAVWQQALVETKDQTSMLQCIDQVWFSESTESDVISTYAKRHSAVVKAVMVGNTSVVPKARVAEVLTVWPNLQDLVVYGASLATIRQGLTASGSLRLLRRLHVGEEEHYGHVDLLPYLQLIKDAVSLQHVKVSYPLEKWAELPIADLRSSTQHLLQLELTVVRSKQESRRTVKEVVCDFLTLVNLSNLEFLEPRPGQAGPGLQWWQPGLFRSGEVSRIRRAAGHNDIQYRDSWQGW